MKITDYRSELWPQLEALWIKSWTQTFPQIDFEARRGWFNAHMGELQARDYATFCAMEGDELLGFVTFDPESGHLDQIAVAPAHARKGVGAALLNQVRARCEMILLDVNVDNKPARDFYAREGFEVVSEGVNERSGLKTLHLCWRAA